MISKIARPTIPLSVHDMFPQMLLVVFFSGTMRGFSAPYFNLFLDEQQFSGTLIGMVLSIAALVELVMIPTVSNLADRTRTHRLLFQGLMITYVLAMLAMLAFPVTAVLFVGMIVVQVNLRSTFLFAMQLAFTRLEQHGKSFFGRVRSISAGGFMIANLTAGVVFGLGHYAGLFVAAAAGGLTSLGLSGAMPQSTADKPTHAEPTDQPVRRNRQLYPVLAAQFFVMMGLRSGFAFWLLHFQDNLGVTTAQIAIIITLAAIMEIPWFMIFDVPLRKYSAAWFYVAGAIGLGLHWVLIGAAPSFAWVLVILVSRGPMFAMWNMSILVHINQISQPRNVATNQAIAQITIPSLAGLIASAPLGYVYDQFPPVIFFSICCGLMVLGGLIMLVSQLASQQRQRVVV